MTHTRRPLVLNVGVIKLGLMGMTHLQAYAHIEGVRVVAVADPKLGDPGRQFERSGNIEGLATTPVDLSNYRQYRDPLELIQDPQVQAVDICSPTPGHYAAAMVAIAAGKHVFVEKPMARTSTQARAMAEAAHSQEVVLMPGHCMRFWPGWTWLRGAVTDGRYGAVRSARFVRFGARPGGAFYSDGMACGGAHLDMHIHDSDFVQYLFGPPRAVHSLGAVGRSGAVDYSITQYDVAGDARVSAEGGWHESAARPFEMRYLVEFERATADFEWGRDPTLLLFRDRQRREVIPTAPGLGYEAELAEFVRCASAGKESTIVTAQDGVDALVLNEAELESIRRERRIAIGEVRSS